VRKNCGNSHNIILEYEESMQVWEEIEDTGEVDSSGTDTEEEEELIGEDLLEDLDKAMVTINPPVVSKASPSYISWSKRILRQTILTSSIPAEIESNIDRADWDKCCYEECRKLLQHTAEQIGVQRRFRS
jgi:hypothetical protein